MPISRSTNKIVEETDAGGKPYSAPVDSSVDPYGVQQSGETGAVTPAVATIINPSTATGYAAGAYERAQAAENIQTTTVPAVQSNIIPTPDTGLPNEAPTGIEGVGVGANPVAYSNVKQNLANIAADMDNANADPEAQGIPNAVDPYDVQRSGDLMYGKPLEPNQMFPAQPMTGDTSGTTGGGYTGGGGGTGTGGTSGGGTGGGDTGAGQPTQGDAYFNQAASMQFNWTPESDPGYNVAWQQAQKQITGAMVSRGALWSSVNQNALTAKNFELQALFYEQAYDKFKEDRNFLLQLANMSYDREDEAWNRKMEVIKFNADREDAAFSKAMQQQQLSLSYAKFEFDKQMQEESMNLASAKQYVSNQTAVYSQKANLYTQYYNEWATSGNASNQVAAYFGVRPGTSITALSAKNAIQSVYDKLANESAQLAAYAENTNSYGAYLDSMNEYMTMTSASATTADAPTATQNARFTAAKAQLYNYTDYDSYVSGFYNSLATNSSWYISNMGESNYNALIALADKQLQTLANKRE